MSVIRSSPDGSTVVAYGTSMNALVIVNDELLQILEGAYTSNHFAVNNDIIVFAKHDKFSICEKIAGRFHLTAIFSDFINRRW